MNNINQMANNQFVIETDNEITFQSYNSTICKFNKNDGSVTLGKNWDYSRTTHKYLCAFLRKHTTIILPSSNMKRFIQELIDDDIVLYDEGMI